MLASLVGLINIFTGKNCCGHVSTKVGNKIVYYKLQRILRSCPNVTTHNLLSLFTDFGHMFCGGQVVEMGMSSPVNGTHAPGIYYLNNVTMTLRNSQPFPSIRARTNKFHKSVFVCWTMDSANSTKLMTQQSAS